MNDTTGWLEVGAEVVEYTDHHTGPPSLARTRVAKIGKRDVVLENGNRFPVATLVKHRGAWDPDTYLLPIFDPRVVQARRELAEDRRQRTVHSAHEAWRRDRTRENAEALRDAVEAWIKAR